MFASRVQYLIGDPRLNRPDVKFDLPENLEEKVATFGESSYGATLVTLVLKDGTRIYKVHIAWGKHVVKASDALNESLLNSLNPAEIADVILDY